MVVLMGVGYLSAMAVHIGMGLVCQPGQARGVAPHVSDNSFDIRAMSYSD